MIFFNSILKRSFAAETLKNQERQLLESSTGIQCFLRSITFTRRLNQIQEWGKLSHCTITHLPISCILWQEYFAKETIETLPLAWPRCLGHLLFPTAEEMPHWKKFQVLVSSRTCYFQASGAYTWEAYLSAFLQWTGRRKKSVAVEGEYCEKLK